ncbi:hypothetical protein NPIL_603781 [Nephila pilipes]|uniref:Uncharacterized protein n=1 Tax=Nephila pilipes TaxID=299642 RepID=A0A8X6UJ17_NEPPI|nr:hypothetical protein NPIL_603781 [Nephila pilipes]
MPYQHIRCCICMKKTNSNRNPYSFSVHPRSSGFDKEISNLSKKTPLPNPKSIIVFHLSFLSTCLGCSIKGSHTQLCKRTIVLRTSLVPDLVCLMGLYDLTRAEPITCH